MYIQNLIFTIYHFCKRHETIIPIFVSLNCSFEITLQGISTLQKSQNGPCLIASHRYASLGILNGTFHLQQEPQINNMKKKRTKTGNLSDIIRKRIHFYTLVTDQQSIKVTKLQPASAMLVHFDSCIGFLEKFETFLVSSIQGP